MLKDEDLAEVAQSFVALRISLRQWNGSWQQAPREHTQLLQYPVQEQRQEHMCHLLPVLVSQSSGWHLQGLTPSVHPDTTPLQHCSQWNSFLKIPQFELKDCKGQFSARDPAGLAPQWVLQEDFQGPTCCQSAEWLCGVHALAKLHISLDTFKVFISYCLFISVFPIFHFPLAQINKA